MPNNIHNFFQDRNVKRTSLNESKKKFYSTLKLFELKKTYRSFF